MNNKKANYIKREFDEIVKLCEERISEYGDHASYFSEPATEEEIVEWEKATNISIPETYREWLKLTKTCQICQTIATYIFPKINQPEFIPEDYVMIGNIIGDGEVVCFSKSTKKFIRYFEGRDNGEFEDFTKVIVEIKKMLKDERDSYEFSDEVLAKFAEFDEMWKKKNENI